MSSAPSLKGSERGARGDGAKRNSREISFAPAFDNTSSTAEQIAQFDLHLASGRSTAASAEGSTGDLRREFAELRQKGMHREAIKTGRRLGKKLKKAKKYDEAYDILNECLLIQENTFCCNCRELTSLYLLMGEVCDARHSYTEALQAYSTCIYQSNAGELDPEEKAVLRVAHLQSMQLQFHRQALDSYEESLQLKLETIGENHPSTAMTLTNIGSVLRQLGEVDKALGYHMRALRVKQATMGQHAWTTADSAEQVADLYRMLDDFDHAAHFYRMAVTALRHVQRPDKAASAANSADGSHAQLLQPPSSLLPDTTTITPGSSTSSISTLSATGRQDMSGSERTRLRLQRARCSFNLGLCCKRIGRLHDAVDALEEAEAAYQRARGADHPDTLEAHDVLSQVKRLCGR